MTEKLIPTSYSVGVYVNIDKRKKYQNQNQSNQVDLGIDTDSIPPHIKQAPVVFIML